MNKNEKIARKRLVQAVVLLVAWIGNVITINVGMDTVITKAAVVLCGIASIMVLVDYAINRRRSIVPKKQGEEGC